jgi:sporulation integral membrane protein YtvI
MNLSRQKAFIIHVIYIIFLLGFVYVGIKFLLPLLMPFVIGCIIAVIFRKPIDFIHKKSRISRVLISLVILILFYCTLGYMVSLVGYKLFAFITDLFYGLPDMYENVIRPAIEKIIHNLIDNFPGLEAYLQDFVDNINNTIFKFLTNASSKVVGSITRFATQLPSLLIKLIFTIVSSFFFTIDYNRITRFIVIQFKVENRAMILKLKDNVFGSLGKFIRAYSLIISITFIELSVGFKLIGINNPFLFGLLVAIVDIMPILGTGAVLLPWAIISLVLGNTRVGIGMLLLYIIITAVRQTIEPKIVGQQIGLHPIITLILMYVGAQLMGVLGLMILPIIATILIKMNNDGSIHLFKT